jgi:hypothetical protein
VTEALKTSNIKTGLFILRTMDKERRKLCTELTSLYPLTLTRTWAQHMPALRDIVRTVTNLIYVEGFSSVGSPVYIGT